MSRRLLIGITTMAAILLTASVAGAGSLDKGASEIQGAASLNSSSFEGGSSVTEVTADVSYGYCIDSHWEIAPGIQVSSLSGSGSTLTSFTGLIEGIYNFPMANSPLVPFLRAGVGYGTISGGGGSSINTSIIPEIGGGIRVLMGNSASLNFGAFYEHTSTSLSGGGSSVTGNAFGVTAGFSVFPWGFAGNSGMGPKSSH